jgi:hypothetical protein
MRKGAKENVVSAREANYNAPQKLHGDWMPDSNEKRNRIEIEKLNQRGGRTLTIVDLIAAGTLTIEMAAHLMMRMKAGASILTGAVPGGAGKTTLLAAQLHAIPPESEIVPVDSRDALNPGAKVKSQSYTYLLAHEIGSGPYYGYIWNEMVAKYSSLNKKGNVRIASCLHADTLDEMREILFSPPLNVAPEDFAKVDLILFMSISGRYPSIKRRVSSMYEADGSGSHRLLYEYNARSDSFLSVHEGSRAVNAGLAQCMSLIEEACAKRLTDDRDYRKALLQFYGGYAANDEG